MGSFPRLGKFPRGSSGVVPLDPLEWSNPLQYSCLENLKDRGAWWATVHGITKSWTQLK